MGASVLMAFLMTATPGCGFLVEAEAAEGFDLSGVLVDLEAW